MFGGLAGLAGLAKGLGGLGGSAAGLLGKGLGSANNMATDLFLNAGGVFNKPDDNADQETATEKRQKELFGLLKGISGGVGDYTKQLDSNFTVPQATSLLGQSFRG